MGNPAHELADLLEALGTGGDPRPRVIRSGLAGLAGKGSPYGKVEFWHFMGEALEKVRRFEAAVTDFVQSGAASSTDYGADIAAYYQAIWLPELQWGGQSNGAVDAVTLRHLRLVGDVMSATGSRGDISEPGRLNRVKERLVELRDLLAEMDPNNIAIAVLRSKVEQALRFAENIEHFGVSAVAQLLDDVVQGVAEFAEDEANDPTLRERIGAAGKRLLGEMFVQVTAGGVLAGAAAAAEVLGLPRVGG